MFNFDYKLLSYLNTFNSMPKDRYLSWKDKYNKHTTTTKKEGMYLFKPIKLNEMPFYCEEESLGCYYLECPEANKRINIKNYSRESLI